MITEANKVTNVNRRHKISFFLGIYSKEKKALSCKIQLNAFILSTFENRISTANV